jgi:hypothetical protein
MDIPWGKPASGYDKSLYTNSASALQGLFYALKVSTFQRKIIKPPKIFTICNP